MRREPLHVEEARLGRAPAQALDEPEQGHLRRVRANRELRLGGEEPADPEAVQPAGETLVVPRLDRMGPAELVEPHVRVDHRVVDPSVRARRVGTAPDHARRTPCRPGARTAPTSGAASATRARRRVGSRLAAAATTMSARRRSASGTARAGRRRAAVPGSRSAPRAQASCGWPSGGRASSQLVRGGSIGIVGGARRTGAAGGESTLGLVASLAQIQVGGVAIGGGAPVAVQSMTLTKTHDVAATTAQIAELASAGCEIVRCAVPKIEDADALQDDRPVLADPGHRRHPLQCLTRDPCDRRRRRGRSHQPGQHRRPGQGRARRQGGQEGRDPDADRRELRLAPRAPAASSLARIRPRRSWPRRSRRWSCSRSSTTAS